MVLTPSQKQELNIAILDYLEKNGYEGSAEKFKLEA